MQRILIGIPYALSLRDILETDVLKRLGRDREAEILILVPSDAVGYVRSLYEELLVEAFPKDPVPGLMLRACKRIRRALYLWQRLTLYPTNEWLCCHYPFAYRFWKFMRFLLPPATLARLNRILGDIVCYLFYRTDNYKKLFDKYRPDLIVCTRGVRGADEALFAAAKAFKIPVFLLVSSWDNITSKGLYPSVPDRVAVWNAIMAKEVSLFYCLQPQNIVVTGIPQFDIYSRLEGSSDRSTFFRKIGLDPAKKLVTYTTGTLHQVPEEYRFVMRLYELLRRNQDLNTVQLLVRVHQQDDPRLYRPLLGKIGVVVETPGKSQAGFLDRLYTLEDIIHLGETMMFSDVVINISSTISIDAAVFDTPVVNVNYDSEQKPYLSSITRFYHQLHYEPLVATEGVCLVSDDNQLENALIDYLQNKSKDQLGRQRIRELFCYRLDGQSGQRIGQSILEFAAKNNNIHIGL